jgi:hypothetical protein
MTLTDDVAGYLTTHGYQIGNLKKDFLVAIRPSPIGGRAETVLVWIPAIPTNSFEVEQLEAHLLREFEDWSNKHRWAELWVIHDFGYGFSNRFSTAVKKYNITFRVPSYFFDTSYKYERASRQVLSAMTEIKAPAFRIAQPFTVTKDGNTVRSGEDLFAHLWDEYRFNRAPAIRFVIGPAGIGKTWLFRALFSRLYGHFIDEKKRQENFPRPIPIIPLHLRQAGLLRTRQVLNSFIELEVASPVPLATFEWMVARGYSTWLFDGLDELYAEDEDFFYYLAEIFEAENATPQILVCARESLLTSSENFADFLNIYDPMIPIEVYRLESWEQSSKSKFSSLYFSDPEKSNAFLGYISSSVLLRQLSGLPFYCNWLAKSFEKDQHKQFVNDYALIDFAVEAMLAREMDGGDQDNKEEGKALIREEDFIPGGLNVWLQEVADAFCASNYAGVPTSQVEEFAHFVLRDELSTEERQNAITSLTRFPLFASGKSETASSVVAFKHELIAEYLTGQYWYPRLLKDAIASAYELGMRTAFITSLTARYLAERLSDSSGLEVLAQALKARNTRGTAFTTLLRLMLMASPRKDIITEFQIKLEGHDLSHIIFVERDLENVSFNGCGLSNTVFEKCNLVRADFQNAHFEGTQFIHVKKGSLFGSTFGNLDHFDSVIIDKRRITERLAFAKWIEDITGTRTPISEPCPTSLQLRQVFLRYIDSRGKQKRDNIPMSALSQGGFKRRDAASIDECIRASIRYKYLQKEARNRIRRVPGDAYTEMRQFITDWKLSIELKKMLDQLCPIKDCMHLPGLR